MWALLRRLDHWASERHVRARGRAPLICSWMLHKLYPERGDVSAANGTVSEGVTVDQFDELLRYHRSRGHVFLAPEDLLRPLDPQQVHVLITFDDGYASNLHAMEPLARHHGMATFHISTEHVAGGLAFWWDALYRERIAQGHAHDGVMEEVRQWKDLRWEEQEERLHKAFGPDVLIPRSDLDRPMTLEELRRLAAAPEVRIGDHTHRHLSLPLYRDDEVLNSLRRSSTWLRDHLHVEPVSLAYPYGHHDERVRTLAQDMGYRVGFTYDKGRIMAGSMHGRGQWMDVPRNSLTGTMSITAQCHNLAVGASFGRALFPRR